MTTAPPTTVKRTARTRKTADEEVALPEVQTQTLTKTQKSLEDSFDTLVKTITSAKEDYETLQKQIADAKEEWEKEKRLQEAYILERDKEEVLAKKREQELYDYETKLKRRQDEDAFKEKLAKWEKELQERKDEIEHDQKELEMLRKQVAAFQTEIDKAVKVATTTIQKELSDAFAIEKKLREQEVKSEKEILALKISTLTQENTRQAQELSSLKQSIEEATRQLKDVAVKVIESNSASNKQSISQEE